jgi:sugar lactone lactonase YvrE
LTGGKARINKEAGMKGYRGRLIPLLAVAFFLSVAAAQKVETANGARIVHNEKGGIWAGSPKIKIGLVRTIGGLEEKDPNLAFSSPYDVVRDTAGNILVLDIRECRVQKLAPEGKFLMSIGRRGQGPGEFQSPSSMDIDEANNLFVFDAMGRKIEVFSSEGKPINTIKFETYGFHTIRRLKSRQFVKGGALFLRDLMEGSKRLPKLLSFADRDGRIVKSFGEATDYKDANVNSHANSFSFDKDGQENICLSLIYQNRIEKYSPDGKLVWRADRPLNYGTEVIEKGFIRTDERGSGIQAPTMNMVSFGIAADGAGRIWVNTYDRQMKPEERTASMSVGGVSRTVKQGKIEKLDIHKLEIFDPAGVLLGEIPLNHLVHGLRIFGDFLFVWERDNAIVYQYRIVEIP